MDRLALLVPPLIFLILSLIEDGRLLWDVALDEQSLGVLLAAGVLIALSTAIVSIPVLILWRAISHTVKKAVMQNATFQTKEDFDYYREKLTGVSPVTISLLTDLRIEEKKDVAALLLKYVQMGVVSMEGGSLRVLNAQHPGLLPSDRTLLDLAVRGKLQPAGLGAWKQQAIDEALQSGKLKRKGTVQGVHAAGRTCLSGCLSGCLVPILLFVVMSVGAFMLEGSGRLAEVDRFMSAAPDAFGAQQLQYLLSSPEMVITSALFFLLTLPLFFILWLPIAAVLRMALSFSNNFNWLKRTEEGEISAAQIFGMKNFLRDFSNLSGVDKEQLLLWDDFLIYAVILEENERIIEDIFSMKNLRYRDFNLF